MDQSQIHTGLPRFYIQVYQGFTHRALEGKFEHGGKEGFALGGTGAAWLQCWCIYVGCCISGRAPCAGVRAGVSFQAEAALTVCPALRPMQSPMGLFPPQGRTGIVVAISPVCVPSPVGKSPSHLKWSHRDRSTNITDRQRYRERKTPFS